MRNNEAQRETRKKDKMERELKQCKSDLENKNGEIKSMQVQIERYKQDMVKLEQQLKEQRVSGMLEGANFYFEMLHSKYLRFILQTIL